MHPSSGGSPPRVRVSIGRALSLSTGVALVALCLLAAVAALSYLLLVIDQPSSSAIFASPEETLFRGLGGVFTVILAAIGVRYAYYYYCWYVSRRYFAPAPAIDTVALSRRDVPYLKFQVTTKGGALPVVERSLRILEAACARHPWLAERTSAEVITERADEAEHLNAAFTGSVLRVTALTLPTDYATPNGSRLKARALHHMVELRRTGFGARPGRTFIVHFDEETVMTEPHIMLLLDYLTGSPRPISQGPILYPLEWENAPWLCRAIESTRPFGCSECARVMQKPPPPHLHGSNLVVDEEVENQLGWDFGTIDGQAFVAEDLLFGLRAYALLGREAFGWHGATALEQPPLSLHWAVQQRLRWVLGALQGLRAMRVHPDYDSMPVWDKRRLSLSVYGRIATYALGFPVGLVGLMFLFRPLADTPSLTSPLFMLRIGLLLAAVGWVVSYQIGLRRNLQYQAMAWPPRLMHHAVMLVITPIVGLCETVGPFVALSRWLLGSRAAQWTPTPKVAEPHTVPPVDAPPAVAPVAGAPPSPPTPAPIPAWVFGVEEAADSSGRRPAMPDRPLFRTARVLSALGATVAVFLVYEFLATGLLFNRAQDALLTSFKENVAEGTLSAPGASVSEGEPIALIQVPRIGVDRVVVEGTSPDDLKSGPGHLRGSPMPGEFGNAVLVGRRTTYGGPFSDLDQLVKDDVVRVTTGQGTFVYKVVDVRRTGSGAADTINGTLDSRLTLVTSDPAFLPDGRLSVVAQLAGKPVDVPTAAPPPVGTADLGLRGDSTGLWFALLWGGLLGVLGIVAWRFGSQWPARVRYLVGAPVVLALGVLLFSSVDRVLPGAL